MPLTEKDLALRLEKENVAFELVRATTETPTVAAAAEALGVAADDIVKSVLFADKSDAARVVLVVARGTARVDRTKLDAHVTGRWRLADAEEVLRATGYEAGTVPPVGYATPVPVVLDERVAVMDEVIGGGGGHDVMLRIARRDVERLTHATVADVVENL